MSRRGVVAVAVSGGRDSTALLHASARAAQDMGLQVLALHIHHGLMPGADAWWQHVERQCARWRRAGLPVQFKGARLAGKPAAGDSVEAWARRERYAALGRMARAGGADAVLLAHHRRDQAETFVLQALRGAGAKGLAAMPHAAFRDGLWWYRPWLDQPGEATARYVQRHGLSFVVDESNQDARFARSRLRTQVWPVLQQAFADAEPALTAAARRAQADAEALTELAELDLATCRDAAGGLKAREWTTLSPARRANVLRYWLRQQAGRGVPESLITRLLHEWTQAGAGHRWPAPGGVVHSGRGVLLWLAETQQDADNAGARIERLDLSYPGRCTAPGWSGHWLVSATQGAGIDPRLLRAARLCERSGAEQFQFHAHSQARSLKKQYQAMGVAAALRTGPLLFSGDQLLFVPGLGTDARVMGCDGVGRLTVEWVPNPAPDPAP